MPGSDIVLVALALLPGLACAALFDTLVTGRKLTTWHRVTETLCWQMVILALYAWLATVLSLSPPKIPTAADLQGDPLFVLRANWHHLLLLVVLVPVLAVPPTLLRNR